MNINSIFNKNHKQYYCKNAFRKMSVSISSNNEENRFFSDITIMLRFGYTKVAKKNLWLKNQIKTCDGDIHNIVISK